MLEQSIVAPTPGLVVYDNEHYSLVISVVKEAETRDELYVYGVVNKGTGVREAEIRSYAHAVNWATELEKAINNIGKKKDEADELLAAMPMHTRKEVDPRTGR